MNMKLNKTIYLVALTAAAMSLVGCKKGLQQPTPLPGYGQTKPPGSDDTLKPIEPGNAARNAQPPRDILQGGPGIKASTTIGPEWMPSSDQPFKADTVYFEYDKSAIQQSQFAKLDKVAS